jgi:Flp pilus assembly protein TadB
MGMVKRVRARVMKLLPFSNIVSTAIVFILNTMASMELINNRTTGQLSDKLPNLFVPSGITFSIWGVICILYARVATLVVFIALAAYLARSTVSSLVTGQ